MDLLHNFPNVIFFHLTLTLSFVWSRSTRIEVINNCTYTVWAAANPGGGKQLRPGEKWTLSNITGSGRIWGRTKCVFGGHDGRSGGNCESGDCNGLLECRANGRAPNTVGEYSINQANNNDIFYISVLDGFNIPMEFRLAGALSPTSISRRNRASSKCAADVNGPCPMELRDPGGCNNPCTLFGNDQFCCISGTNQSICQPTTYSQFFTDLCKHAFTYPSDVGQRQIYPTGTDYEVVFCPSTIDEIGADVAKVTIKNNCPRTVWPAILTGDQESQLSTTGFELAQGQSSSVGVPSPWSGRFWARSRCSTDASGKFTCITGDCGSGKVECNGAGGTPPATLVEIAIAANGGQDYYDVSNVDGFNLPVSVAPQGGTGECKESSCPVDINSDCSAQFQVKDGSEVVGCKSACAVFNQSQYCCTGPNDTPETCPPTEYSRFFEEKCPQAYSYAYDDKNSTFTCSSKPDYVITFCP